jgi:hypothetical protein
MKYRHNGKLYDPIRVGETPRGDWCDEGDCGDCGAKQGEYHTEGCDIERCPVCHTQLLSCDCDIEIIE